MKQISKIAVIALALTATSSLVYGQEKQQASQPSQGGNTLVGTWQVLRHAVDCNTGNQFGPDFQALMTFNKGGTYIGAAYPPSAGSNPGNSSPEHGVWSHGADPGSFTARWVNYSYDNTTGAYTGRGEITATGQLDPSRDTFSYDAAITFYDADGNLLFTICGHATAMRF